MASEAPALARPDVRAAPTFVAAPTLRRLALGARTALFCERRQQIFELNPTADTIWQSLSDGLSAAEAARTLGGADAGAFVSDCVAAWLDAGLMVPEGLTRRPPDMCWPLRIGDFACEIDVRAPEPLRREIAAVFGQFAAGDGGTRLSVIAEGDDHYLLQDGAPLGRFAAERIVPQVKAALTDGLAQATGDGAFLLHAALLTRRGRSLLITGAPGAGKTTLTVALAASGFGYGSDDIVRVGSDGALTGAAFSPAVKSGAWPLVETYAPTLAERPAHLRNDGQQVRYLPVEGFAPAAADALGWVVKLDRQPVDTARLEPVEPLAMLGELLAGALSADRAARGETLAAVSAQLAGAACLRLIYSDLSEAVAALTALADG